MQPNIIIIINIIVNKIKIWNTYIAVSCFDGKRSKISIAHTRSSSYLNFVIRQWFQAINPVCKLIILQSWFYYRRRSKLPKLNLISCDDSIRRAWHIPLHIDCITVWLCPYDIRGTGSWGIKNLSHKRSEWNQGSFFI